MTDNLAEQRAANLAAITGRLDEVLAQLEQLQEGLSTVQAMVDFAEQAAARADDMRAEVYLAADPTSLPAAVSLARLTGGRVALAEASARVGGEDAAAIDLILAALVEDVHPDTETPDAQTITVLALGHVDRDALPRAERLVTCVGVTDDGGSGLPAIRLELS